MAFFIAICHTLCIFIYKLKKGMNRLFCPFLNTTAHIKSTNGAHYITKKESCPPAERQSQLHPSEHPSVSMQQ